VGLEGEVSASFAKTTAARVSWEVSTSVNKLKKGEGRSYKVRERDEVSDRINMIYGIEIIGFYSGVYSPRRLLMIRSKGIGTVF
jgi:hypothetical protein